MLLLLLFSFSLTKWPDKTRKKDLVFLIFCSSFFFLKFNNLHSRVYIFLRPNGTPKTKQCARSVRGPPACLCVCVCSAHTLRTASRPVGHDRRLHFACTRCVLDVASGAHDCATSARNLCSRYYVHSFATRARARAVDPLQLPAEARTHTRTVRGPPAKCCVA